MQWATGVGGWVCDWIYTKVNFLYAHFYSFWLVINSNFEQINLSEYVQLLQCQIKLLTKTIVRS